MTTPDRPSETLDAQVEGAPGLELRCVEVTVSPAGRLTFGRAADMVIDSDNPFMHRIVGMVEPVGGVWFLENMGSSTELTLLDQSGKRMGLPPGTRGTLTDRSGTIRWTSGKANYEIEYRTSRPAEATGPIRLVDEAETIAFIPRLTSREVDFMVSASRYILTGETKPPPTYDAIAAMWGVSRKTLDNTLQRLKTKMAEAGAPATSSIAELGALLVSTGAITMADLDHADLDAPEGPNRSTR